MTLLPIAKIAISNFIPRNFLILIFLLPNRCSWTLHVLKENCWQKNWREIAKEPSCANLDIGGRSLMMCGLVA
ncbi:MAG: hypothetical protein WA090_04400 [Candidatus Nanopelagicaceae bacterium]